MALEASNYEKAAIANAVFGGTTYPDAGVYTLKLFSNAVSLAGVGTEITTAGYAPLAIPNNLTNFPTSAVGEKENAAALQMTTLTANSPEIVSAGLFDENGNLRYREVFAVPFTIPAGSFFLLQPGDLSFSCS